MISRRFTLASSAVVLVVTVFAVLGASEDCVKSAKTDEVQKQFDEMKAAFNKLADDNKKLKDELKELYDKHDALIKRFDEVSGKTDTRLKSLAKISSEGLTQLRGDLTALNNTFNDRTCKLRAGGTAIDMGISEIRFQPDGNICLVGKKTGKVHWTPNTANKD